MVKKFKIQELDCANCAMKMEERIKKIDGVHNASINFMMQRLTIEADEDEFDRIIPLAQKECQKVDSCCKICAN